MTRLAPVVVSERERRAARAALELHARARPATVRGLGGFSVAPALDAALNADDAAGGRDALLPAASVASPIESQLVDDSASSSTDWVSQGYFERDPESVARPPKRWVVPLVGVVLLVAAGVLVFAAVQRFFEKRATEQANRAAPPAGAVADHAGVNPTLPLAPPVGAKSEQGVGPGPGSLGTALPLTRAPSGDVSKGEESRTVPGGGIESSTSLGVARGESEGDSERTGAASPPRGQVRPQRRAATPPPQGPASKRVPDEPIF